MCKRKKMYSQQDELQSADIQRVSKYSVTNNRGIFKLISTYKWQTRLSKLSESCTSRWMKDNRANNKKKNWLSCKNEMERTLTDAAIATDANFSLKCFRVPAVKWLTQNVHFELWMFPWASFTLQKVDIIVCWWWYFLFIGALFKAMHFPDSFLIDCIVSYIL